MQLAARCQSFATRWACVLKRPIFYLAAYIDNNGYLNEYFDESNDIQDFGEGKIFRTDFPLISDS